MGTSDPPDEDERVGLAILAAGAGTRMRSAIPKPLHIVAGVTMIERVLRAGAGADPIATVVVVSPGTAEAIAHLSAAHAFDTVLQDPPRGTGDAARRALDQMPSIDRLVVLFSDHPLLEAQSITKLLAEARTTQARVTILSAMLPDAAGFGRVVRDEIGRVNRIAERRDDDSAHRQGPTEINTGMMALDAYWAREALLRIQPSAATSEFYLTDLVQLAAHEAAPGMAWPVAAITGEPDDALGVNDRIDLAHAESRAWDRKRERLMRAGVTMRLPETIAIDENVVVGSDTVILPHSTLLGETEIGAGCLIGPSAVVRDSWLGDRVIVRSSTIEDSRIAAESDVGPYSHLRAGCEIGPRVHIGNFAELKNANLAAGVKVGHFSYVGDAELGSETNIGAGVVTANFDGARKHRTEIGARAFIGSDTVLRAPVRIGNDARTGAGSVVTKDVPDGATVVGVPARVVQRAPDKSVRETEEE